MWTPIGSYENPYLATFDGQGYTVSGLYFNDSSVDYVGFFGYANVGAVISNLSIADSYFNGSGNVGGICGYNYGLIESCQNSGEINGASTVGGVCGRNVNGRIENSQNVGTVIGTHFTGGVCGQSYENSTIKNCKNSGSISGSMRIGGVCGYSYEVTIENSQNVGSVSGDYGIGGVVGIDVGRGTIKNCYYNNEIFTGVAINDSSLSAITNVLGKTTAEFKSGEVAYLLQGDQEETVWAQTIGTDEYPVLKVFSENSLKAAQLTTADSTVHYANEVEDGSIVVDGTGTQFKVVLNTNAYGGEGAKYLEAVNIYNNNTALTDNSTAPMYYTYDENDNNLAVFTFTNQNTEATGTIRAEVTTKENAEAETVLYFVSKEASLEQGE